MPRLLLMTLVFSSAACSQDFARLLEQGPVPYLHGPALLQVVGNLTAGDGADLACGDYDADGREDLLVGSAYGDLVFYRRLETIYESPRPMLSGAFSFSTDRATRAQVSPELADLDADGTTDLLLAAAGEIYFYSRRGGLQPGQVLRTVSDRTIGQSIGSRHLAPCATDLDGDGDLDLLIADEEGRIWWLACLQANPLQLADPVRLAVSGKPLQVGRRARVCAGDWDGDARYDIVIADMSGQVMFVRGRRDGFDPPQPLLPRGALADAPQPLTHLCPRLLDVTGDGKFELLLGCRDGFVAIFERGPQGPVFQGYLQARQVPIDAGRYAAPTTCDWNNDGLTDIVTGAEDGLVRLYLGRRDGRFETGQTVVCSTGPIVASSGPIVPGGYSWPRLADLNGDGVSDLALGGAGGAIEMYLNQGGLRLAGRMRIGSGDIRAHGISAISLADHDGDGDPDLFVGDLIPAAWPATAPAAGDASGAPQQAGPRFVLPAGGLSFYENEAPKGMGMPLFLKGVRLAAYIGKRGRTSEEDALDAGVLGPGYIEPLSNVGGLWTFLIGARTGYYVFNAMKPSQYYPMPILPSNDGIPNPLLPPLYSCTAASLRGSQKGLLCGLADYGFVCWFAPDQIPQLNPAGAAP